MQRAPLIHNPLLSRQRFLQLTAAGAAGAATLGTGLSAHAGERAAAPKRGGILRLGQVGDVLAFDGPAVSDNTSIWTMLLIYDQLTRPTADGLNVEPSLAQSWDISPDGKIYTFHLRRDVKFHDGSPMTAEDVKFSYDRALKGVSFLFAAFKDMEVVDQFTVRAHLKRPHAPFLTDVAIYSVSILPKKLVLSMGKKFFDHPIGTGPFMLKSWAKGSQIVLSRNPGHFRGPKPYVDEIHQVIVPDPNSRILQVQNGELDVALFVPPAVAGSLQQNPSVTLHVDNFFDSHFICIQTASKPWFGDKSVRQAMNYAVDKDAIVKHLLSGFGEASGQAIPKMFGYNEAVKPYPFDLAKAKALMAASKYPKGFATSILVDASTRVPDKQIAEFVQQSLKPLNIDVSIEIVDDATFTSRTFGPKFEMNVQYMTSDIIDPDELMGFAVVPGAGSDALWTYYKNPAIDRMATQAAGILDRGQRQRLYGQIDAVHHDDAPMIFLYHAPSLSVTSAKLQGFKVLTTGNYRLEECWFSS